MVSQADIRKERVEALSRMLEKIDSLKIEVEHVEPIVVRHRAVIWWNANRGPQNREYVSISTSSAVIDRITVNYIRHKLTKYDKLVLGLFNKAGQITGARRLHERVMSEIARVYPSLRDECERQMKARYSRDLNAITVWKSDD